LAFLHEPLEDDGEWSTDAYAGAMLAAELVHIARLFLDSHVEAGKKMKRGNRGRR
jgi:hypothetical protein